MTTAVHHEWDGLTGLREKKLAAQIDKLSAQGLSAIQIASRVNLRVSVVWKYLQTGDFRALK